MAVRHGYGKIAGTDALVFAYDTGDTRNSYKGEPTTNVVADPLPTTGWSVAAGTQGSALTRTYLEEEGKPFMRFSGVTNGNDYPRVTNSAFANSATITGTFSTSLEVRGTAGAVLRFRIYENGSTKITNTITLTSEWTRYTFDNQTTGFNLNQPYFNPATSDAIYDIRNIQVEAKAHSTPFVNGTRSSTQGLVDLTGNSTIDLANVSFDSNAQMTFDGTDDKAVVANFPHIWNGSVTMESVVSWNDDSRSIIFGNYNVGANDVNFEKLTARSLRFYWNRGERDIATSTNVVTTTGGYHHVVMVRDKTTNTFRFYVDSVLVHTVTNVGTDIASTGSTFRIGGDSRDGTTIHNGNIPALKLYNRALTAAEVRNNYNQYKGRFNI